MQKQMQGGGESAVHYDVPPLALAGGIHTWFYGHANCRYVILIHSDLRSEKTLGQTEKKCIKIPSLYS